MRDHNRLLSLALATLLVGCAGPATKPSASSVAIVPAAPAAVVAPAIAGAPVAPAMDAELARLQRLAPEADPGVLALALEARACALSSGEVSPDARLAVIDYSRPSTDKRLWVFDLAGDRLLHREYVAHGSGSGENMARRFSNVDGSHATSLGLFRTAETYIGGNGYSLRLDGLDPGFNDHARSRAIVMHGAWYVNPDLIRSQGRLGRSQGCPALRQDVARVVIDELKQRQLLFAYADDAQFLRRGRSFACSGRSAAAIVADARDAVSGGGLARTAIAAP